MKIDNITLTREEWTYIRAAVDLKMNLKKKIADMMEDWEFLPLKIPCELPRKLMLDDPEMELEDDE